MIEKLRELTGISDLQYQESVQSLWSGYGEIARYYSACQDKCWVVKQVTPPDEMNHPRGWNSDLSHQRKLTSYRVESQFYQHHAPLCSDKCRVPGALVVHQDENQFLIVLEDIDAAGFPLRFKVINKSQIRLCLAWLAHFHARFLNESADSLWSTGTYWHLETRPDELSVMPENALKSKAAEIDQRLNRAKYQTIVHGDAKLANFCFDKENQAVAAVDFQYVGGSVGVKDVMLFLGSCLTSEELTQYHNEFIIYYFNELTEALNILKPSINHTELEQEWRSLIPFAWADFHRFLSGWSPDHFKINEFMLAQTDKAIAAI